MKLLAKPAEERYQTAAGLEADLRDTVQDSGLGTTVSVPDAIISEASPSVLAAFAGVSVSLSGLGVWPPLMTAIRMVGDIAVPLMLLALGVRLADSRIAAVGFCFGGSTVLLRAVPADVEPQNAEDLLVEIADRLLKGSRDALNEHTEWVLHSISCRAAIKAGDKSSPQELMALAEKILSGEVPPFCPHGRPCVLKLTRKELEKQFGRIV